MTLRLLLPDPDHASRLVAAVHESIADLCPWMEWASETYSEPEALKWICETQDKRAEESAHEFFIADASGALLGTCGVNRIDPVNRLANLGYWIRSSQAGRGLAVLAARTLADWAFANTSLHRLEIVIAVDNHRSRRVAEKVGALEEGVLRSRLWLHGKPHDAAISSIVRPSPPVA
jgi:ribosomal-protein-serine acetyltransferase